MEPQTPRKQAAVTDHPGPYIRKIILPKGLSVKKAAELLNVGRPALSNLLNGNASLSREMALRLEKAFGVKAKAEILLRMQSEYDEFLARERAKQIAVPVYAPGFIQITAARIEDWVDHHHEARHLLPALLRRLVLTTGDHLTKVDFPAFDNAERPGWDGQVGAEAATPWIPAGLSGWEFGSSREVRQKADSDYKTRVANIPAEDRKNTTFVFVTPRNWPRTQPTKEAWAKTKQAEGKWKDVRVIDASDLEQWLEQSVPAQSWLAKRLGPVSEGVLSLDECWELWSKVTEPELAKELFDGAINRHKGELHNWIMQPPTKPFVVSANSTEEALAFVCCALNAVSSLPNEYCDRAVVLLSVDALKKATTASSRFIAVIASREVELALAGLHKTQHTIIIRGRNAVEGQPDIALDLVDDKTFRSALTGMGILDEDIPRYARESGQSPTVLRRRLSQVPEIKNPPWSENTALARKLVPLAFVGAWKADTRADREILSLLSGNSYDTVEESVAELLRSDQPPVWSIDTHRGVLSKVDVLFGIHQIITRADLEQFFFTAGYVLSEKDPALQLPEDKRWVANLYGKSRDHSSVLREGLCETLVLLAVHGNDLFQNRLGLNIKAEVDAIVRNLLTPLDAETWESQQNDLPRYAEAAPDVFLDILENDFASNDPQVLALLRPANSGMFGHCARSGLLWGLEILAWSPKRALRVSRLLARLSETKIEDNWVNKPENSLTSIFRSWVPQTAATVDDRAKMMEILARDFPNVGWRLCLQQFDPHATIGHYSARPRWRNDAAGAGQVVTVGERNRIVLKAIDIALAWPAHDERSLGDLVERLWGMPLERQVQVWEIINAWIASSPSDEQKAYLRERIRRSTFTRHGRKRGLEKRVREQAKAAYERLIPHDPVIRHQWLFAQQWVDESFDELEDDTINVEKWERKIGQMRSTALEEVWKISGYQGVVRLCESGDASYVVGRLLAAGNIVGQESIEFIYQLTSEKVSRPTTGCISGFLEALNDGARDSLILLLIERFAQEGAAGDDKKIRLLLAAPFRRQTWLHVESLPPPLHVRYWKEVLPYPGRHDRDECRELIVKLLEVNRPRAAFFAVHFETKEIEPVILVRLLTEVATKNAEPEGHYRLQGYEIEQAMKALAVGGAVTTEQLAQLEFMYLSALEDSKYGIPHLEQQLSKSPALFMQAIGLTYKRSDDGEDPPEWLGASTEEAATSIANQAYRLLHQARRLPGTQNDGSIKVDELKSWISEIRVLCSKYARDKVGGHVVGEFLARSQAGKDGIWPCEPVREALEEVGTKDIADGMIIGAFNSRGAMFRGEGGNQERELATQYRQWSKALAMEYPFVSNLLEEIAKGYDSEAKWHDNRADVRRRVGY
jgi:addiction module HigA family antidote